jgi:hypothetical protein
MKKVWGRRLGRVLLTAFMLFSIIGSTSAAHWVTGFVNNALDGEPADSKYVVLWNPANGVADNLTDIVGVNGNSGSPGVYMIDCEMLAVPCVVGDELNVRVYDRGDNYVSNYTSVTVTVAGYDMADNLTLNSPPLATVISPVGGFVNDNPVEINCSFSDFDSSVGQMSLYSNFSGGWSLVDTKPVIDGYSVFSEVVSEGEYGFYCEADDYLVVESSAVQDLIVDRTNPTLGDFSLNESFFCGATSVRMSCDVSDNYFIDSVWFSVESPSEESNYTAVNISMSNYVYDLITNEKGDWDVSCFFNDTAGNVVESSDVSFYEYSGLPELMFNSSDIDFSNSNPWEDETINISVNVSNLGCVSADNFMTSFFLGNPVLNNYIGNVTGTVGAFSSFVFEAPFVSLIGVNDIFIKADNTEILVEDFEDNNIDSRVLNIGAWQEFYGNVDAVKVLGSFNDSFGGWSNDTNPVGNVFMADSEADINWASLLAVGKNTLGVDAPNDFSEIDLLLGMGGYLDSVVSSYGSPTLDNFFVHRNNITNVAAIQSTDNDNFHTGILWDSSDDSDGEFDSVEKEDLVFVSKINDGSNGKYGSYDYEIKIPAKLREYDSTDVEEVYFYYELI